MRNVLSALLFIFVLISFTTPAFAADEKEWTFLIYLNGNNSLDSWGATNIKQMEKIGSSADVNVVVQWASLQEGKTQRLLVTKGANANGTVNSPIIENMGDKVDMGDYHSVVDFVKWGVAKFLAKHYFVNIWNHGGGWHLTNTFKPMDISWDDRTGHFITTHQLGLALAESAKIIGHKVDLYGSDACLMAMPEVALEVADSVEVFAGSEETEPAAGWPYTEFLKAWTDNGKVSAVDLSKILTNLYVDSYSGGSNGRSEVTFSAFDMNKMAAVVSSMKDLGTELRGLSNDNKFKVRTAINATQSFAYRDYGDLVDFLDQMQKAGVEGVKADVVTAVRSATTDFVITNKVTHQYSAAHGASIWLPGYSDTLHQYWEKYKTLKFEDQTAWGEALKAVLNN